ncbi:MAG TPA: sensor domain-containing diguanylate cyclase [Rhodocyclaceae bacterium]|nr:sensor domain-containing diguanylate cyclase [Rhodocyclaceae bacterium]
MSPQVALHASPVARLTLGLMGLVITMLLGVNLLFDVIPNREHAHQEVRMRFAETLAAQVAALTGSKDDKALGKTLQLALSHNREVLSLAVREASGYVVEQRGDHDRYWTAPEAGLGAPDHMRVPIQSAGKHWGDIEISFAPVSPPGSRPWIADPLALPLAVFFVGGGFVIYAYLRRVLHYLDPSTAIPDRVRKAFDAFSDGVVVLSPDGHIVLANNSFRNMLSDGSRDLHGRLLADLPWIQAAKPHRPDAPPPWLTVFRDGNPVKDYPLSVPRPQGDPLEMSVGCSPIADPDGRIRGCLLTFDDVTDIQRTNDQLRQTLMALEDSRRKIEMQNEELRLLATRDPLTGCLNRRAFFEMAGEWFEQGLHSHRELSCIMADIDHFKLFNDLYGHSVGDQVIQVVARTMSSKTRTEDALCRYGGEEFCILLPDTGLDLAQAIAERMRAAIEAHAQEAIRTTHVEPITASFGVASIRQGALRIEELIDQADSALYQSKENGRNQVTSWQPPED